MCPFPLQLFTVMLYPTPETVFSSVVRSGTTFSWFITLPYEKGISGLPPHLLRFSSPVFALRYRKLTAPSSPPTQSLMLLFSLLGFSPRLPLCRSQPPFPLLGLPSVASGYSNRRFFPRTSVFFPSIISSPPYRAASVVFFSFSCSWGRHASVLRLPYQVLCSFDPPLPEAANLTWCDVFVVTHRFPPRRPISFFFSLRNWLFGQHNRS